MRRFSAAAAAILLLFCLALPVSATSTAQNIDSQITVSDKGTVTFYLHITLSLDAPQEDLVYPLPEKAGNIILNGRSVRAKIQGGYALVDLSGVCGAAGVHNITISYTLNDMADMETEDENGKAISKQKQRLILTVPLLGGFAYPVEKLEFTVTLPGTTSAKAEFTSGYLKKQISNSIRVSYGENTVYGTVTTPLMDRETLVMTLPAAELFPDAAQTRNFDPLTLLMLALAAAAAVYWFVFLRCPIPRSRRAAAPPAGLTAGQLGSIVTGQGVDLTMMVLSWAQLGYILIHLDDNGRVLLHRRMRMGNERSAFENRCFRNLFGSRQMIDGTGYRYAQLCRRVAAAGGGVPRLFRPRCGNRTVFQGIMVLLGALGGARAGSAIAGSSALSVLVTVLFAIFAGILSWGAQQWARFLQLRGRRSLLLSLLCAAALALLGLLSGKLAAVLSVTAGQLLAGLAAAYGGRRTETGKLLRDSVLGLRGYLKTVSAEELRHSGQSPGDYFFSMAPYAFALGVEQPFAQRFGSERLSACPYLTTGMDGHLTASEWNRVITRAVNALDARQKHLPLERLFGK